MFRVDKDSKQHVNISAGPLGITMFPLYCKICIV